ncbi:lipoprotein releasing system, transmembrane protein, LolC/E family [Desulfobulbus propionicus DSM 2032]|uniref:Lipoprotein releasing system, transmembrane protein, LolC/E family n=1 Tax=Desulfobulbus propionicus (strain ATCC 33891 / DSM 2032 / VKM B-1956 / 1pr3) TaxID=577650 RepID=A0A7U3YKK0_DESPD|nr:lipoprotein-releasing ABC transporter permease subunit [Desulfobulbus propionicus]ADW17091.1 lipoprotein releasing system, transmembrane protein, LolC/E family [Desulfobulbus propionicus DSM 2032]
MAAFEWFVSLRYLRAKRKQKFISLITVISILGVAVGVLALIVVLSVWTGFTEGLRDQIIGVNAHALVQRFGGPIADTEEVTARIQAVEGVAATTPFINGQALISSSSQSTGVFLRGIDAASALRVLSIGQKMQAGALTDLDQPLEVPAIVLGRDMARQLQVGVGDRVRLMSPNGPLSPMGVLPKIRTCLVVGIFHTGMSEYDSTIGYISLDTARSLTDLRQGVHGIEIRVADIDQADRTAQAVQQALGSGYSVRDWMRLNQNMFAALKLEKTGIFIALNLIILVAALNIISALTMVVMEKNRDIAILKSMGATTRSIMRIFFYQGMVIGLSGTVIGLAGGLGLCALLKRYKIIELPPDVYPMSTMPIKVVPFDVGVILISAIVITLAATLYPSWKASRIRPAEALSYE